MSETKLKSLKVVDLKDILSKASVSVPAKANKQDLIARILGSPAALDVYNEQQNPSVVAPISSAAAATDDLLAPPEDFDWEGDETGPLVPPSAKDVKPSTTAKPAKPASKAAARPTPLHKKPAPAATAPAAMPATEPVDTVAVVDDELEKRKKRAARFGVPLVESPESRPSPSKRASNTPQNTAISKTPVDNPNKLQARAARFGLVKPAESGVGNKRSVEEVVDAEELKKRKKRAERFGIPPVDSKA